MANRMAEVLAKAADALDEGTDPFSESFLSANDVTFDECMTMAANLALGARILAKAHEKPALFAGAMRGALEQMRLETVLTELNRMA